MPTITLNKTVFEKLLGKKLPLEQLKDRISMLGTGLEKIEGNEIFVEIFPNRPDLLSEQGLARAVSSFIGVKKGLRKYEVISTKEKVIIDNSVKLVRPYTACAIVKNLHFDEEKIREIIQIQEKLHVTYCRNRKKAAIGIYPLEKITFPITYKADRPEKIMFKPLEANREMSGREILNAHKTGKEYAHLLEGKDKFPFFIDAKQKILSMPPIINSEDTGRILDTTKDIFVECSGFDYETLRICLNIIVTALADMGGKIYSVELHYDKERKISPNLTPRKMKFDLKYINQRLGLNLKEREAKELLERMGYGVGKAEVLIPAYRADVLHQIDLAEDMAIAYGYENFPEIIPKVATVGEELSLEKFMSKIREVMIGLGLIEVKNYHLITSLELNEKMNRKEKLIPLKNALGDYNHLRNAIIPSLLRTLTENQHNEYPQNIFELGRVFFLDEKEETGVKEIEKLAVAVCHEKADFTELKQMLDLLISTLGLEYKIKEGVLSSYIPGRVGRIVCQGVEIGCIGELHPQLLENWNLIMPTIVLELDMEKLFGLIG